MIDVPQELIEEILSHCETEQQRAQAMEGIVFLTWIASLVACPSSKPPRRRRWWQRKARKS